MRRRAWVASAWVLGAARGTGSVNFKVGEDGWRVLRRVLTSSRSFCRVKRSFQSAFRCGVMPWPRGASLLGVPDMGALYYGSVRENEHAEFE